MKHNGNSGKFVISLDTELSWGSFDTAGVSKHKSAYEDTRNVIDDLCDIFDEYNTPVTWALVMHLLDDNCENHSSLAAPNYEWVNWFGSVPCSTDIKKELWHAPDILDRIQSTKVRHEIGLHGYSHLILGAEGCTREAARAEVQKAVEVANEVGINPETYIFPRNSIGHIDILRDFGIRFYRGVDKRWYENYSVGLLRKPLRFIDEAAKWTPPVVTPKKVDGMVEIPGSQILRPYIGPWQRTPTDSQLARAKKGLDKAAKTGNIFHLWFHPFNLAKKRERHLNLVKEILKYASKLRKDGYIEICTIAEAAQHG